MSENHRPNLLVNQTSPYLQQHAFNPVNWYPWELGLEKARKEKKPIFISIGYAACHWCHVMEKESFSDPETAAIMNNLYINIKIDREERPDLDSYYQKAVSFLSGRPGGWPLSVFATPKGEAFAGGTYFPKKHSYNLPSFQQVLKSVHTEYERNPEKINEVTQRVLTTLRTNFSQIKTRGSLSIETVLENSLGKLIDSFDEIFGGFGVQPKFPQVSELRFLLSNYYRLKNERLLDFITKTLDNMVNGGIYDQLGFGFHRYSVDRKWLVPHFEKMLYDNAQLLLIFLEVFQITRNQKYAEIVHEIIEYLRREMLNNELGCFYSSQDADSEGEEGKFFKWNIKEIQQVLGEETGNKFALNYGVIEEGNFENGYSILHRVGKELEEDKKHKQKLFLHREKRVKPFLNDNIISSWNSLLIYSLARASFVLDSPKYLKLAENAVNFITERMTEKETNRLFRHFKGKAKTLAFAEDYAFLISALIELFTVSRNQIYLDKAIEVQNILDENFWDSNDHGYYFNGTWYEDISFREKPVVTFAIPSPNSVSLENMLRLYHLTGENQFLERAEDLVEFLISWYEEKGHLNGDSLIALEMYKHKPLEIVTFTKEGTEIQNSILQYFQRNYLPHLILLNINPNNIEELKDLHLVKDKIRSKNLDELFTGSTFICKDFSCSLPLNSITEITRYLRDLYK
ncbi:MAG: thioredoxin domain-containing protein [Candidatus Hodarchaeota archaeon]